MAKASVATIFKAYCFFDDACDKILMKMEQGVKETIESAMSFREVGNSLAHLTIILQNCDLEVEIPPESEPFIAKLLEISRTKQDSGKESPPESLGWRH